jgi:methyltransferase (TIGR00027 family)
VHADDRPLDAIGSTSLGIAFARAQESRRPDRLFDDPYAERFVAAAAEVSPLAGTMTGGTGSAAANAWTFLVRHVAIRTRFFDDYLADAVAAGSRQVVLVAAGLDARGLRLPWPPGVHLFELDQGPVLELKERVLQGRAPAGGARRTLVPVDLREDWPAALVQAGFDAGQPAAWLVEGLLPALTATDSDRLLERLSALAAPGSWIACDDTGDVHSMRPLLEALDPLLVALWKGGPGGDPAAWLRGHGWDPDVLDQEEEARRYGRAPEPGSDQAGWPRPRLVRARRQ